VIAGATRAIDAFMRPQQWRTLQRNAMSRDYGWAQPVARFVGLYASLADARPAKSALGVRRAPEAALPDLAQPATGVAAERVARRA
jgi:starch synthase